jgi:hypothetical protein
MVFEENLLSEVPGPDGYLIFFAGTSSQVLNLCPFTFLTVDFQFSLVESRVWLENWVHLTYVSGAPKNLEICS